MSESMLEILIGISVFWLLINFFSSIVIFIENENEKLPLFAVMNTFIYKNTTQFNLAGKIILQTLGTILWLPILVISFIITILNYIMKWIVRLFIIIFKKRDKGEDDGKENN